MKAIKITDERMAEVLPSEIKNTDVLSDNAKKTLATIMNYFAVLNIAKSSKYLVCPNSVLREAVGIRNNDLINAVQELIECDLIERQVGHKRVEGEKAMASTYVVKWSNLVKPIKKKNTFEELFSEFLKSSGNPLGTTDTDIDTDAVSDTVTDIDTNVDIESDVDTESEFEDEVDTDTDAVSDIESEVDTESVIDNEVEVKEVELERQFEIACGVQDEESDIPVEIMNEYLQLKKHQEEEDLSVYLRRTRRIKELVTEYPQLIEKKLVYSNTF